MKISRVVGTTGELVPIFVQDATVSTGAGLPNLTISTFSSYYYRSDMTSTSSVTLVSTGTLGTWSSGQFLQINSSFMRGWYQFCLPNGVFANGSTCAVHMYGHPSMAPVVMELEIVRFNNQSALVTANPVGVSNFQGITVGVSSVTDKAGYSVSSISVGVSTSWFSGAGIVTTQAGRLSVDVSSIIGTKIVTTFAGYPATYFDLGLINNSTSTVNLTSFNIGNVARVGVSSFGLPVGVSSFGVAVGVSSFALGVDVTSLRGTAVATSFAGVFPAEFNLQYVTNFASTVNLSSVRVSSQSVTVGAVDVTSFYGSALVTTAAGILGVGRVGVSSIDQRVGVSSFGITVGISSNPIGVNVTSYRDTAAVTTFAGYPATYFDLGLINNSTSTVRLSSFSISTLMSSVSFSGSVDVTSFYGSGVVTSAAGVLASHVTSISARVGVSSFGLPVGVSSMAIGVGVTTFNSRVGVSSFDLPVGISTVASVSSQLIGGTWDEILTGATHNIATSAGRRLRQLETAVVSYSGTADGTPTASTIQLSAPAAGQDNFYVPGLLVASVSTGTQFSRISAYTGATSTATLASPFAVVPAAGDSITIIPWGSVRVTEMDVPVDVTSFYGSAVVTTAAGILSVGRVGVSSFGLPVGVSSMAIGVGVTTFNSRVGVSSIDQRVGVSSFGLTVGISSNPIGVNVTSYRDTAAVTTFAGYPATYFDLGLINNSTSTVRLTSFQISSQSVSVGSVDVTSFYGSALVTTAAGTLGVGRVGVSSFGLSVGVSSNPIGVNVTSVTGITVVGTGTSSNPWGP